MQRWLACLALVLISLPASAQTTAQNLAKYQRLRDRLLTEFTVVGPDPGQSQPADLRDDEEGFIKWADSTIRLGWYVGVLATEHYLVTHPAEFPGAQVSQDTLDELYHALLALERLDRNGDAAFPPPCTSTPSLNGFFIRDDVPDGFHQNFPPLHTTFSDFVDPVLTNKEMSQDQVYHLLIGLALVKALVPSSVSVNGRGLTAWAVEQARRIIEHVVKDFWVIKNPACADREVDRGDLAAGLSGGTRRAIAFITDGAYFPDAEEVWIDVWERESGNRSPSFAAYIDIDNLHMSMAIAAVGNGWGDTTADDLANLGSKPDWPLYGLLHRALHGERAVGWCRTGAALSARARTMLDELPDGAEIGSPRPGGPAPHGFTRSNRFMREAEKAYTGEEGSEGHRYNGLDALLLHNLLAIAAPSTWQGGSGAAIPQCPKGQPDAGGSDAGTNGAVPEESDGGCGCRMVQKGRGGMALFALALALAARARRRRTE
jgi:MYXO-CTERM domain-containing protein